MLPSLCEKGRVVVLPGTPSEMLPIRASLRTFTAKKKRTPNLERRPSIVLYPEAQHLVLIVLTSTHDWQHACVAISQDGQL